MKHYFGIILVLLTFTGYAQDFDRYMVKKPLDCSDISYNCGLLFEKYMTEDKTDSAKLLLKFWESRCDLREPIQRARLLLALKEGKYNDSLLTDNMISFIINYQNRIEMIRQKNFYSYDNYKPYYGFIPLGQEFDQFTHKLAGRMMNLYPPTSVEYLLCEFYGENSDTLFDKLQKADYLPISLRMQYLKTVNYHLDQPEFNVAWITGLWIPTGKLATLGVHPELGMQFGGKYRNMSYDLTLTFRILKSDHSFYAKRKDSDSIELTDHFFGGYVGFEVARDLVVKGRHEFSALAGIAYDGFDVLKENKDANLKGTSVNSYNFNLGFGYRYYYGINGYLGLRAKYNIVDYTLNQVIDFTGNTVTIQFIIGGLSNAAKRYNLSALKYRLRGH